MEEVGQKAKFQHTAARRRLEPPLTAKMFSRFVSTHSRPKAAGSVGKPTGAKKMRVSTHSRPKAAGAVGAIPRVCVTFQHTAA